MDIYNLPIGQQYFSNIRKGNALYIDKTEYIYNICKLDNKAYFLSRPRRFGKSLTIDTIQELFEGNKDLFKGLWIEDKWDWTQTHPVLRFSLDTIEHEIALPRALIGALQEAGEPHGVTIEAKSPSAGFKELIKKVAQKTGKSVVVLIDEYDRPIADYVNSSNLEKARKQRDILKQFLSILKGSSNHIRLLFITGVSKFAQVSIFSDLNHLDDLTIDPRTMALCGYTQEELEHYFKDYIAAMPPDTLEKMKLWYNGYSWDAKTWVYNPFSVLNFFSKKMYRNYWFSTGTPSFLMRIMRQRFEYRLEETEVPETILEKFHLDNTEGINLSCLLLQTGYLTIKGVTPYNEYVLNYPNEEVRQSFGQFLLGEYIYNPNDVAYNTDILKALDSHNLDLVRDTLHNLIQAIPDQNYISHEEKFIHAVIHLIFTMIGSDVRSEVHTPTGRIDMVVVRPEAIFLFEYKINETADAALAYIEQKNYVAHLKHRQKPIVTQLDVELEIFRGCIKERHFANH